MAAAPPCTARPDRARRWSWCWMTEADAPIPLPTVVLVDDHGMFRAGVRSELEGLVEVVGEAGDVDGAVREIVAREPDVVLLDVHLPGGGGVEILRRLADAAPGAKCLPLSVSDDPEDVIAVI